MWRALSQARSTSQPAVSGIVHTITRSSSAVSARCESSKPGAITATSGTAAHGQQPGDGRAQATAARAGCW